MPEAILLKISKHLMAAEDLVTREARSAAPVLVYIERAQDLLAESLGDVSLGRMPSRGTLVGHLRNANALAEEHLRSGGREGRIRFGIRKSLSEAEAGSE